MLDRSKRFNLLDLELFCKRVEQMTSRDVDVVTVSEVKDEALRKVIDREGVRIYEREKL